MSNINEQLKKLLKTLNAESNVNIYKTEKEIIVLYKKALAEIRNKLIVISDNNYQGQQLLRAANEIETILTNAGVKGIKTTEKGIKDIFKLNYTGTTKALKNVINIAIPTIDLNAVNSAYINKYSKVNWQIKSINNISEATHIIRNDITGGIINGKSYSDISKNITKQLNIKASDAIRIVRTETARASNESRLTAFNDSEQAANNLGYKLHRVWLSSGLPASRHGYMDGQVADENNLFYLSDGNSTEAPCLSGDPSQDVNCSCTIITELQET